MQESKQSEDSKHLDLKQLSTKLIEQEKALRDLKDENAIIQRRLLNYAELNKKITELTEKLEEQEIIINDLREKSKRHSTRIHRHSIDRQFSASSTLLGSERDIENITNDEFEDIKNDLVKKTLSQLDRDLENPDDLLDAEPKRKSFVESVKSIAKSIANKVTPKRTRKKKPKNKEYSPKKIVDKRVKNGELQYRVFWDGYSEDDENGYNWEVPKNQCLTRNPHLIDEFENRLKGI